MEHSAAILLRKSPWSETSLIVTWLTRSHGATRTLVRGARKPGSLFAGKLDLFYQGEISFVLNPRSDLHVLREMVLTDPFVAGEGGYASLCFATYCAELSGLAAPAMQPAPEIFDLLDRALKYLRRERPTQRAVVHFERELCRLLGVFDASGAVPPLEALRTLCGRIPRSREEALRHLEN